MRWVAGTVSLLAAAVGGCVSDAEYAASTVQEASPAYLVRQAYSPPPAGLVEFCGRETAICDADSPVTASARSEPGFGGARRIDVVVRTPASLSDAAGTRAIVLFDLMMEEAARTSELSEPARQVRLTPDLWDLLYNVNLGVNRAVKPASDLTAQGVDERWDLPLSGPHRSASPAGDCEDFALEKRQALLALGLPSDVIALAVGKTTDREPHAVLIVRTDRGDIILDNRSNEPGPLSQTSYTFTSMQTGASILSWSTVKSEVFTPSVRSTIGG